VPVPDKAINTFLTSYRARKNLPQRSNITDQQILERCLYALVNESFKLLEEGIASSTDDIDLIWIYGFSWPKWTGGPMYWARKQVGYDCLRLLLLCCYIAASPLIYTVCVVHHPLSTSCLWC